MKVDGFPKRILQRDGEGKGKVEDSNQERKEETARNIGKKRKGQGRHTRDFNAPSQSLPLPFPRFCRVFVVSVGLKGVNDTV